MLSGTQASEAARILGCSTRWLADLIAADPSVPHFRVSKSVRFTGQDIEEIRARFSAGEYRYDPRPNRKDGE